MKLFRLKSGTKKRVPQGVEELQNDKPRLSWKKILLRCFLAMVLIIIAGQFIGTEYRVIRVKNIKVRPAVIHPYVNNINNWEIWFPWNKLDKRLNFTVGEITSGVGANLNWTGEDGTGTLTLTRSSPEKGIDYSASLYDGNLKCDVSLHYTELEKGTTYVSWAVKGNVKNPLIGGYVSLLMEPVVGSILNRGLKNLKKVVLNESGPPEAENPSAEQSAKNASEPASKP